LGEIDCLQGWHKKQSENQANSEKILGVEYTFTFRHGEIVPEHPKKRMGDLEIFSKLDL
jgi:hypothetical protein